MNYTQSVQLLSALIVFNLFNNSITAKAGQESDGGRFCQVDSDALVLCDRLINDRYEGRLPYDATQKRNLDAFGTEVNDRIGQYFDLLFARSADDAFSSKMQKDRLTQLDVSLYFSNQTLYPVFLPVFENLKNAEIYSVDHFLGNDSYALVSSSGPAELLSQQAAFSYDYSTLDFKNHSTTEHGVIEINEAMIAHIRTTAVDPTDELALLFIHEAMHLAGFNHSVIFPLIKKLGEVGVIFRQQLAGRRTALSSNELTTLKELDAIIETLRVALVKNSPNSKKSNPLSVIEDEKTVTYELDPVGGGVLVGRIHQPQCPEFQKNPRFIGVGAALLFLTPEAGCYNTAGMPEQLVRGVTVAAWTHSLRFEWFVLDSMFADALNESKAIVLRAGFSGAVNIKSDRNLNRTVVLPYTLVVGSRHGIERASLTVAMTLIGADTVRKSPDTTTSEYAHIAVATLEYLHTPITGRASGRFQLLSVRDLFPFNQNNPTQITFELCSARFTPQSSSDSDLETQLSPLAMNILQHVTDRLSLFADFKWDGHITKSNGTKSGEFLNIFSYGAGAQYAWSKTDRIEAQVELNRELVQGSVKTGIVARASYSHDFSSSMNSSESEQVKRDRKIKIKR